jgi:outer membrane protein OmpA-like peptidoglycan-associated protein
MGALFSLPGAFDSPANWRREVAWIGPIVPSALSDGKIIRSYSGFLDTTGKGWDAGPETPPILGQLHPDILVVDSPSPCLHKLLNLTTMQQWRSFMTENAKNPTAQNTIQDPLAYNTEKQSSDRLGEPQNGDEIPGNGGNASGGGNALESSARSVYFAFDSYEVDGEYMPLLQAQAQRARAYLNDHPDQKLHIDGNTDSYGSPEYNLALGMRRATAVSKALMTCGVAAWQMETRSWGEMYATGQDEETRAKDRRVDFVYQ